MKLPLAYYGDPILRNKSKKIEVIDEHVIQLVADMKETMESYEGCGLAAPQVHQSLALFVTCIPKYVDDDTTLPGEFRTFINPKIIAYSEECWICEEGCLSIPGLDAEVMRPLRVTIEATDLDGKQFTEEFSEFDAHVIMHENDHINGVLYIDRVSARTKKSIDKKLRDIKKKYSS